MVPDSHVDWLVCWFYRGEKENLGLNHEVWMHTASRPVLMPAYGNTDMPSKAEARWLTVTKARSSSSFSLWTGLFFWKSVL